MICKPRVTKAAMRVRAIARVKRWLVVGGLGAAPSLDLVGGMRSTGDGSSKFALLGSSGNRSLPLVEAKLAKGREEGRAHTTEHQCSPRENPSQDSHKGSNIAQDRTTLHVPGLQASAFADLKTIDCDTVVACQNTVTSCRDVESTISRPETASVVHSRGRPGGVQPAVRCGWHAQE